jgi:hypothetical protein
MLKLVEYHVPGRAQQVPVAVSNGNTPKNIRYRY